MTWILILQPHGNGWPAIIGGFSDRDVAVAAGKYACEDTMTRDLSPEEYEKFLDEQDGGWVSHTHWRSWTVISGDVASAQKPDLVPVGVDVELGPATVAAT